MFLRKPCILTRHSLLIGYSSINSIIFELHGQRPLSPGVNLMRFNNTVSRRFKSTPRTMAQNIYFSVFQAPAISGCCSFGYELIKKQPGALPAELVGIIVWEAVQESLFLFCGEDGGVVACLLPFFKSFEFGMRGWKTVGGLKKRIPRDSCMVVVQCNVSVRQNEAVGGPQETQV